MRIHGSAGECVRSVCSRFSCWSGGSRWRCSVAWKSTSGAWSCWMDRVTAWGRAASECSAATCRAQRLTCGESSLRRCRTASLSWFWSALDEAVVAAVVAASVARACRRAWGDEDCRSNWRRSAGVLGFCCWNSSLAAVSRCHALGCSRSLTSSGVEA